MSAPAILLVGHGSRDPDWSAPLERLAAAVKARKNGTAVRLAYLEFMHPDIPAALADLHREGVRRVSVVPVFLGAGAHVRRDIARLLEAARVLHPDLDIGLEPAVGEQSKVIEAIAAAVA